MAIMADAIKFVPASSGTGDFVYSSTTVGYRSPVSNLTNGATYNYRAESADLTQWEIGSGTWTSASSTLARTTIIYSSTGAKVSFSAAPTVGVVGLSATVAQTANNLSDLASPIAGFDNLSVHGADIASASTVDLGAATGDVVDVTGTTTITAITLAEGKRRIVRFTGALTLTHGASLVLPGAANITTAAGDYAVFVGYAAGVVRCVLYSKASGYAVIGTKAADQQVFTSSGTWTKPSGFGAKAYVLIQCWGAGGGGARATGSYAGGGGGGGYKEFWILLSSLGSTETVTIGAGGTGRTTSAGDGTDGGNTTFGSWITAYGGQKGSQSSHTVQAAGGGMFAIGGAAVIGYEIANPFDGAAGGSQFMSLGGRSSVWGGAGGGAGTTYTTAGTSQFGGNGGTGGASPTNGSQPGGGGGGGAANVNGKDGGAGKCIVTVFDGA